jgi:phosphomannomutase
MISLGVLTYKAQQGVVITASHNPPSYNGYKLKGAHGGPSSPQVIQQVEDLIPQSIETAGLPSFEEYVQQGLIQYVNLEQDYIQHLQKNFDLQAINNSNLKIGYDAMMGAGQNVIPAILPQAHLIRCTYNPSFMGQAPEPLHKNLLPLSQAMLQHQLHVGLATDGDADRIGLYDAEGQFVDAHHIILLLVHYLYKYKNLRGKVVVAFSTSTKVHKLCAHYGIPIDTTPVGFKYISQKMMEEDVLVGGEESGGIAVKGHIPERDGIWDGLVIMEFMAKTGKTLQQLIQEVYDITGAFVYERNDLKLSEARKQEIINLCNTNQLTGFGNYGVKSLDTLDGFKFELEHENWVMIRASGTEPLLRIYAQGRTKAEVDDILKSVHETLS